MEQEEEGGTRGRESGMDAPPPPDTAATVAQPPPPDGAVTEVPEDQATQATVAEASGTQATRATVAQPPTPDAAMAEVPGAQPTRPEVTVAEASGTQPPPAAEEASPGPKSIQRTPVSGGRYKRHYVNGTIFELTARYKPPIKIIGRGAYGVVCSALDSKTREKVAIKKIANTFADNLTALRTLREIKLLRLMNHENVIAIRDIIPPPLLQTFNDVYIVYELMDADLHKVTRSNQNLSANYQHVLYQILCGLKYIHSANVFHRDLKPGNILLNEKYDLKICDFGFACIASETDSMKEYVVTRCYRPPELLPSSSEYTTEAEIWSVGCIFMELMDRKTLFPWTNHNEQRYRIAELIGTQDEVNLEFKLARAKGNVIQPHHPRQSLRDKFRHLDPEAIDLVEKILKFDHRERISVEDALAHPYLKSWHDISKEPVCQATFRLTLRCKSSQWNRLRS